MIAELGCPDSPSRNKGRAEPTSTARNPWPTQVDAGKLQAYYKDAYAAVRKWAPDCFFVVSPRNWEQDGGAWQNFMVGPTFTKVLQDVHRCELSADSAVPNGSLPPI